MNKKVSIIVLVAAAIIAAIVFVLVGNKTQAPQESSILESQVTTQESATTRIQKDQQSMQPATYIEYKGDSLLSAAGTQILFFHAPWCPQCRALDDDITKNITSDTGVTIYKVDYDTNQALRQKYGVTLQTTLVRIDENGNLVKKYVAYEDPTYAQVKANLF